ncbi:MAG: pyroglutamyl-peptidase I [Candidatus Pacebacteria bacterium]|jgi:pyroglutamyl-peptidase|nr:pyroglutamyl-peptidase I [Candidatus Paceibacterota bacterium]
MKTVLLTGFEPFGNYTKNPSQDMAVHYNNKTLGTKQIIGIVLPCSYFGAFSILKKKINEHRPHMILSIGLASQVKGIRFETKFQNRMYSKYPDATGYAPVNKEILPGSKSFLYSHPIVSTPLLNALRKEDIPVEISNDAESFVCNALGYLTARTITENKLLIQHIFIHIPWTDIYASQILQEPEKVCLPEKMVQKAIELIIQRV